jgi:hypothetical protein
MGKGRPVHPGNLGNRCLGHVQGEQVLDFFLAAIQLGFAQHPWGAINIKLGGKCECGFKEVELGAQTVAQELGGRAAFAHGFHH